MAKKRTGLGDDELPTGVPDRLPKKTGKRACEACTVVGPKATVQFCMRRTGKPPGKFVGSAPDVCSLMKGISNADRESFWALHLDVRHNIVDIDKVSTGSMTGVEVHPREVFRGALLSGANNLIFVHNHPSGNVAASRQDVELTKRLRETGEMLGIPVLDHIVVGRDSVTGAPACSSLAAQGLMGGAKSNTYPLLANQAPKLKRKRKG
jgi:DNA repair protein RadC